MEAASVAVMERSVEQTARPDWHYKVRPFLIKGEKFIEQGNTDGFYPVKFVNTAESKPFFLGLPLLENAVVMERGETVSDSQPPSPQSSELLAFWVLHFGKHKQQTITEYQSLQKASQDKSQEKNVKPVYRSFWINHMGKRFIASLSDKIESQSLAGFQYCGLSELYGAHQALFKKRVDSSANLKQPEYKFISEPAIAEIPGKRRIPGLNDTKAFQQSLSDSIAAGYKPIDLIYSDGIVVVILEFRGSSDNH
jgi:hypothetical protein